MTIGWYVDGLKISHIDASAIEHNSTMIACVMSSNEDEWFLMWEDDKIESGKYSHGIWNENSILNAVAQVMPPKYHIWSQTLLLSDDINRFHKKI